MAIRTRSTRRIMWEQQLERLNPVKKQLIRALPLTCPNSTQPDRKSDSLACTQCNGTGYLGAPRGANLYAAPYSAIYLIFADVQAGHGLYGSGGDLIRVLADLGKTTIGDAMLYCKIKEVDHLTGASIVPSADPTLPRPDRIIDNNGTPYNVVEALRGNFGDEDVFMAFTLKQGSFK